MKNLTISLLLCSSLFVILLFYTISCNLCKYYGNLNKSPRSGTKWFSPIYKFVNNINIDITSLVEWYNKNLINKVIWLFIHIVFVLIISIIISYAFSDMKDKNSWLSPRSEYMIYFLIFMTIVIVLEVSLYNTTPPPSLQTSSPPLK